ncbi:MAG: ABC transporter [Propionibacteriaceae bacterium]|jgi:energy-coupling factor transporter ATP-binding protein EcfA2|nr:ABC transporter [Propionibacteriaceae bacterium]
MGESLLTLLAWLRDALVDVRLTIPLPGAADTRQWASRAVSQLDDYVLPRLQSLEAPLVMVVGGSTGAGKSTLVNSLLGKVVSTPGVIRPTTKAPILVHNPADASWFSTNRILPELARTTDGSAGANGLTILGSPAVPEGLAIVDAPDIDSVDLGNRTLANQLLSAADLWLFVTSAARYADAVPWDYLARATERTLVLAVVLDRVPPTAMSVVPEHLARMMTERGLGDFPLFAVPETATDSQGLLPFSAIKPIRSWLDYLASNRITRARVVMRTLDGALAALQAGAEQIAGRLTEQRQVLDQLRSDADTIFAEARHSAQALSSDGTLLRGEVLTRWQDFVGTGEFMRNIETKVGRARDRLTRLFTGAPDKALDVKIAVKSGLEALIIDAGQSAVQHVRSSWSSSPAGRFMIDWSGTDVGALPADFPRQVEESIRAWQVDIMNLVAEEGTGKRSRARLAALGVNAAGVALMLVAFAHTAGLTGAEVGIAGGTAVVAQKVLELIFGDEAIRRLAASAEARLGVRIDQVLDAQLARLKAATLDRFPAETVDPATLVRVAAEMGPARANQMRQFEETVLDEGGVGGGHGSH